MTRGKTKPRAAAEEVYVRVPAAATQAIADLGMAELLEELKVRPSARLGTPVPVGLQGERRCGGLPGWWGAGVGGGLSLICHPVICTGLLEGLRR